MPPEAAADAEGAGRLAAVAAPFLVCPDEERGVEAELVGAGGVAPGMPDPDGNGALLGIPPLELAAPRVGIVREVASVGVATLALVVVVPRHANPATASNANAPIA